MNRRGLLASLGSALAAAATLCLCTACAPAELDLTPHDDRYQRCAARFPDVVRADSSEFAGTVLNINDATPFDGPVKLTVVDGRGALRKLFFESLYTIPGPSAERQATYAAIAASRPGDCVHVSGRPMPDGRLWVDLFVNLDHR